MATIKISDIEAYLNQPFEADINLWNVPLHLIFKVEAFYGGEVVLSKDTGNTWIIISSENIIITLNTKEKVKTNCPF